MKKKPPALYNIGIDIDPQALANFDCRYPVTLVNECAHQFLASYRYCGSELIYCDPPYLSETRTSLRKYRYDYAQQDHTELLELLNTLPCPIILSGYPSSLYDELLKRWRAIEIQVMNQGGVRTEKVWFNFALDRVHWIRYAGNNFTDRQRIKRKAQRWGKNYQSLPRAERLAVFAALMEIEACETD